MSTHSPLSVYHLLCSILIPQHPVPLASMRPNHPRQLPQHPRASPVAPFSPHLKDCPLYSRKLFCFSIIFCRSVTHRSPDLPKGSKGDLNGLTRSSWTHLRLFVDSGVEASNNRKTPLVAGFRCEHLFKNKVEHELDAFLYHITLSPISIEIFPTTWKDSDRYVSSYPSGPHYFFQVVIKTHSFIRRHSVGHSVVCGCLFINDNRVRFWISPHFLSTLLLVR